MKFKTKFSITTLIFILVFSISTSALAHYDTAYWSEIDRTQTRSGWMDWLPNNMRISDVSLPGTHDSMTGTVNLIGNDIARTQSMSLHDQLMSGIRVIDIRAKYDNGKSFPIHHGIVYLGVDLEDVLKTVKDFLKNNPTEAVFMRFSQEQSNASDDEMHQLFYQYYAKYKDIFYQGKSQNPTIGEVRGKLVLLSDVLSLNQYGISYRSIDKQDSYHLNTNWDLYSKWEKIKNQVNRSNQSNNSNTIYMNYLSGSGGSFPYFVASGHSSPGTGANRLVTGLVEPFYKDSYMDFPRGAWFDVFATIYFEGTNTLTADYLNNNNIALSGMVMADFPGERLINNIIECNLRQIKKKNL